MDNILVLIFVFASALTIIIVALALKITVSHRAADRGFITIVVIDGSEDTQKYIDRIISRIIWTDEELIGSVILVDGGLSGNQIEICRKYCEKYDFLFFSSPEEIKEIIMKQKKISLK